MDVKKSDLTVKGFNYSIAQKTLISHFTEAQLNQITDLVKDCISSDNGKNTLRQEIFIKKIPVDNYIFSDLIFCCDLNKEKEIMLNYYSGFDLIEDEDEIEEILKDEYLQKNPDIQECVKENLLEILKENQEDEN